MAIRRKGNGYQVDVTYRGRRSPRLSCQTHAEAVRLEADIRAALIAGEDMGRVTARLRPGPRGRRATAGGVSTIGRLADHVLRVHWRGTKSVDSTESVVRQWLTYLGDDFPVAEITADLVDRAMSEWTDAGASPATLNRRGSALKVMLRYAKEMGEIEAEPAIRTRKEYAGRLRWFTDDEVDDMLEFFAGDGRMLDMVTLALDTGMRYGELRKLRVRDYNPETKKLTTWETKGNVARSIPLTERAASVVERRSRGKLDYEHLFRHPLTSVQISHRMRAWKKHMNLPPDDEACFHSLRHTCCSRLVQAGVPLVTVQRWMGHKAIQTTLRYAHLAPDSFDGALDVLSARSA